MSKPRSRVYFLLAICVLAITSLTPSSIALSAPVELPPAHHGQTVGALPAARSAARVAVAPAPAADGPTRVTLSGSGFQYQPNAPGGVYVFFGAVTDPTGGSWAPSRGGRSGQSFVYASTSGSQLLVAFQGGSSAEAANAQIKPDGTWSTTMTIPGATFQATSGNPHAGQQTSGRTIDCRQVQCGIITIGAHGMWNANNESFTPVNFAAGNSPAPVNLNGAGAPSAGGASAPTQSPEALPVLPSQEVTETPAEPTETASAMPAAPPSQAVAAAAPAPESSHSHLQTIVIAIFAVGVLALLGALVYLIRARRQGASQTN